MKLVSIFVDEDPSKPEGLFAVQYNEEPNEFRRLFKLWHDTEYLERFFHENFHDLQDYDLWKDPIDIIKTASKEIINEANELQDILEELVRSGFEGGLQNLQHIFKPLDNRVYELKPLQKSKASIKTQWRREPRLRIYAIRLAPNLYIVTGGAIKLTPTMNERPHLIEELRKLEKVRQWLQENNIWEFEDINEQM